MLNKVEVEVLNDADFNPSDLFQAQSLIIRQEIIENRYLKYILLSPHRNRERIIKL